MPRLDLELSSVDRTLNVSSFSFTDDATPLGIDDSTGSTGTMNVTLAAGDMRPADAKRLRGRTVTIGIAGQERRAIGKVTHVSGSEEAVGIDIDSVSLQLAVKRKVKPFVGRLEDAMLYWADRCKVPAAAVLVEEAIADQEVALVGFEDSVWLRIKQFCAAVGIEVVVQDNAIVVRRPRSTIVDAARVSARSWDVDDDSMAQIIQVTYYDPRTVVSGDYTADFSRSNVASSDADDPNGGLLVANAPVHALPQGYKKKSVLRQGGD